MRKDGSRHVGTCGLYQESSYILVVTDAFTKVVMAFPSARADASDAVEGTLTFASVHGVPDKLVPGNDRSRLHGRRSS